MQEAFSSNSRYTSLDLSNRLPIWDYDEDVLTSKLTCIPEGNVIGHVEVYVNCVLGEIHDDPQPSTTLVKKVQKISALICSTRERWEAAMGAILQTCQSSYHLSPSTTTPPSPPLTLMSSL